MKGLFALAALLAVIAIVVMMPVIAAAEKEVDKSNQSQAGTPGTLGHYLQGSGLSERSMTASIGPEVTEVGKISWSIDGLGVYPDTTGTIQVEKPAGAKVKNAYMAAATTGGSSYKLLPGDIKIDSADVVWTNEIPNSIGSYNYWADVTSLVKAKVDAAPAGRVDFTITETPAYETDGELLAVIFDDPAQTTDNTIILMFGAQQTTGDNFNILLAKPIDLTDPNLALDFSLASSFSNQDDSAQYSIVDVNGHRMTSWAGGDDDGTGPMSNGELFTVGGLDDSTANPADPNAQPVGDKRYDDELYTLLPFVSNGDTTIAVQTQNPSNDDNLLFAGLFLRSVTASVGQILLAPASAKNIIGATHTVIATVQDEKGNPIVGKTVTFSIISGPNTGMTGKATTDSNGQAKFSYTSNLAGIDTIRASFVDESQTTITSNEVTKTWESQGGIPVNIDIKPGLCPNLLNLKVNANIPIAILGTIDFDVKQIDPTSVRLGYNGNEIEPVKFYYADVATPFRGELCGCTTLGPDGNLDLVMEFSIPEINKILDLPYAGTIPLTISGALYKELEGNEINGQDCVKIPDPCGIIYTDAASAQKPRVITSACHVCELLHNTTKPTSAGTTA